MIYVYEGHLGSIYTSENEYDFDDLYCEDCGDSDTLLFFYETLEEGWNEIKKYYVDNDHLRIEMVVIEALEPLLKPYSAFKCIETLCELSSILDYEIIEKFVYDLMDGLIEFINNEGEE